MVAAGREDPGPAVLVEVLGEARRSGFLGPGPLGPQIEHAQGFVEAGRYLEDRGGRPTHRVADLGAGGGLPGLLMALRWPGLEIKLIDSNARRATFLRSALYRLGLTERAGVLEERAEVSGRDPQLRSSFDGVVARSFGRPAVVAECAAPLLRLGGWLVVSEPPETAEPAGRSDRWPPDALVQLGLEPVGTFRTSSGYQMLRQGSLCPERFPRRVGVPAKRPLF